MLKNLEKEARNLMTLGKQIGVFFGAGEEEIVAKLIELEERDAGRWRAQHNPSSSKRVKNDAK